MASSRSCVLHSRTCRKSATGRWAGLAASFAELGVDIDTAKKFGPIVIEHVREHGGENLVDKIRVALNV